MVAQGACSFKTKKGKSLLVKKLKLEVINFQVFGSCRHTGSILTENLEM